MTQPHVPLPDYQEYTAEQMADRAEQFLMQMRRRHSVRSFSDRPVSAALIKTCIAAAATAPSGANHQPWHFCAIGSPDIKRQVRLAAEEEERAFYAGRAGAEWLDALAPLGTDANKPFLEIAPWLIVVFAQRRGGVEPGDQKKNYYINESVGIACGMLITALHQAGLASLTHTPNPMSFLNEICNRPETEKPFLLIPVGYPAADATVPVHALSKKPLDDILTVL
ncbi:nitroreductase family protein [Parvularcula sp. LCG005]|nr:nitroreductase family protein [Parvularcula sp. LCG005]WOI54430.1 nitroreductase family protein [Parvularcula sp. LCG005]